MADTVNWLSYEFTVYERNTNWNNVGGIYIFTGLNLQNLWVAYYIGETGSFSTRIPSHERWFQAVQLGATHVHARGESLEASRVAVEIELIQNFDPPLNKQYSH